MPPQLWRLDDGTVVGIATETGDNPGSSITNAAENAASSAYHYLITRHGPCDVVHFRWFEHYPAMSSDRPAYWDDVTLARDSKDGRFHHGAIQWSPVNRGRDGVLALLDGSNECDLRLVP